MVRRAAAATPACSSIGPNTVDACASPWPPFFFNARGDEKSDEISTLSACPAFNRQDGGGLLGVGHQLQRDAIEADVDAALG